MKSITLKNKMMYLLAVGLSIFCLFFMITGVWIGHDVKQQCHEAQAKYQGDCVEALIDLLNDEGQSFAAKNSAIWALGQLGDQRALATLRSYYTGNIPDRESLSESLSQYELKKAIHLTSGGINIASWLWKFNLD
jgi:hypothetical protein